MYHSTITDFILIYSLIFTDYPSNEVETELLHNLASIRVSDGFTPKKSKA